MRKMTPSMRRVLLELNSGRACRLVPDPQAGWMKKYQLEALPDTGIKAQTISRTIINALESRGYVLVTPDRVTLLRSSPAGNEPMATTCCPWCQRTIELRLFPAADAAPGDVALLFRKGTT